MRAAGVLCLAGLAIYFLWMSMSARAAGAARANIARHLATEGTDGNRSESSSPSRLIERIESTRPARNLRHVLDTTGLPVTWWMLLRCWLASIVVLPVSCALITGSPAAFPAGLVLAVSLPGIGLKWIARSRERKAASESDGLAADLALFLRTGMRVEEALVMCAADAGPRVAGAASRFQAEVALGGDVDAAFKDLVENLDNRDLNLIAQAMATSHETGSDIARIMDTIGETVRERAAIRRELGTQTLQGRMSGRVVAALPLIFLGISALMNRSTIAVLLGTVPGFIMLAAACLMNFAGFLWIRKILDISE